VQITVNLPDDLVHQARSVAKHQGKPVGYLVCLAMMHHLGMEGMPLPMSAGFGGAGETPSKKPRMGMKEAGSLHPA
jgi:hypothetical protein